MTKVGKRLIEAVKGIRPQDEWGTACPHPARDGFHEIYASPDGSSHCRACGERWPATEKARPAPKLTR